MKLKQKLLDCNPFDKDSSLRNVVTRVVANDDVNVHDYEAVGKSDSTENGRPANIHLCLQTCLQCSCLQCFDTVGWAAERASGQQKTEWWGAGVVICLEPGEDLYMAQLMPLPLTVLASVKSRLVLPFWHRPTHVVLKKGPLNRCVCI